MFGVSNAIAYNGLMVSAKTAAASPIRDVLGSSAWIDIEGAPEGNWCETEGKAVLELLLRLSAAGVKPDLYIVTPFVIVAQRLRDLILESRVLEGWVTDTGSREWTRERIGTVHTTQGREAEAVIFVLGAPAPAQAGARSWAGGKPNLLNVAATRAKEVLYVVGNRRLWREVGVFRELDARLGVAEAAKWRKADERQGRETEVAELRARTEATRLLRAGGAEDPSEVAELRARTEATSQTAHNDQPQPSPSDWEEQGEHEIQGSCKPEWRAEDIRSMLNYLKLALGHVALPRSREELSRLRGLLEDLKERQIEHAGSSRLGCGSPYEIRDDTTPWQDNAIRTMEGD